MNARLRLAPRGAKTAAINGGAINVQGGATLTLIDDTFFDNSSDGLGGALSNLGTLTAINVTFAANHGSSGSAIATGNENLTIYNSVFDNNAATSAPGALSPVGTGTTSNNVFFNNTVNGTPDDRTGYGTSNFIVATSDPLGLLADNGGPTQTMLPLLGGAAISAGSVAFLPDGVTRISGASRGSAQGIDAGSVQHQPMACPCCRRRCSPSSPACWRCSPFAA